MFNYDECYITVSRWMKSNGNYCPMKQQLSNKKVMAFSVKYVSEMLLYYFIMRWNELIWFANL